MSVVVWRRGHRPRFVWTREGRRLLVPLRIDDVVVCVERRVVGVMDVLCVLVRTRVARSTVMDAWVVPSQRTHVKVEVGSCVVRIRV